MLTRRLTLLGLALSLAAGAAVAANPAPAAAASGGTTKTHAAKEKQTCEKRSKMGHCEKWAPAKSETAAKPDKAKEAKPN